MDEELAKHIENIRKEREKCDEKISQIEGLVKLYPDLSIYTGRWKKMIYCSKLVNTEVDSFDRRYNCGCCYDSPLEAWIYLETEYGRVYSSPAKFIIGEKGYDGPDRQADGWKDNMRKKNISEVVIDKIDQMFKEQLRNRRRELLEEVENIDSKVD